MRIISKFKDYYDYIAHLYGSDPMIVYHRKDLDKGVVKGNVCYYDTINITKKSSFGHFTFSAQGRLSPDSADYKWRMYDLMYLCINGSSYLCLRDTSIPKSSWQYYENIPGASEHVTIRYFNPKKWYWVNTKLTIGQLNGTVVFPELVEICRELQAPVFLFKVNHLIDDKVEFVIEGKVPVLSELGMAKIYPPTQLYQDLSYFMANTIRPSPDTTPPVKLTDTQRISQRGFDLVTSFRGPRNGKT